MAWRPMGSILQADRKESSTNAWAFLRVAAWAAEHNATRAGVLGGIMRRHLKVRGRLAFCQCFQMFTVGEFGAFLKLGLAIRVRSLSSQRKVSRAILIAICAECSLLAAHGL